MTTVDKIKLTVNLTPKANDSLNAAAARNRMMRQYVVNRALELYDSVTAELADGKKLAVVNDDGTFQLFRIL